MRAEQISVFLENKAGRLAAVEVEDKPGGLHRILDIINKAGINVEYMYAFVTQGENNAIMIFRFDNIDEAIKLLEENNVKVINGSKVYTL